MCILLCLLQFVGITAPQVRGYALGYKVALGGSMAVKLVLPDQLCDLRLVTQPR
jgi:hypothetical protein